MGYGKWVYLGFQYAILFAFWLLLSGRPGTLYLTIGALSAALVLFLNSDIFRARPVSREQSEVRDLMTILWRGLAYSVWLIYSIIVANIQVAYLVLHPRMPIDPALLQFRVLWRRSLTQVVLANSITLTPGTVTAELQDGRYIVHTLATSLAQPLALGKMQQRVAAVFGEESGKTLSVSWAHSVATLKI